MNIKQKILMLFLFLAVGVLALFTGMNLDKFKAYFKTRLEARKTQEEQSRIQNLANQVLPKEGFVLSVSWGDLGPRLIKDGVIDIKKFEQAVKLTEEQRKILTEGSNDKIKIDATNSQFVVDFLWAVGLAQKSIVYTEGPLGTQYKTQVGNFASTGGWTLAKGNAVNYLSKFDLIPLTSDQQKRVGEECI